jgi:DNA-binding transcriptional MerR regulator
METSSAKSRVRKPRLSGMVSAMAARYRIGEFADLSGVSVKTLRFYDEIGLLRPASIDHRTRYRHYLPQQLQELASIVALKSLGVPLSDIRRLLRRGDSNRDRRILLSELKQTIEDSIQAATHSLNWINAALNELENSRRPVAIVVKREPPLAIASLRAKVKSYAEIARFEQELLNSLPSESVGTLRGVLWHTCADSGSLEGEPFVALRHRLPRRSIYDVKLLPPITAATAYSALDDESAEWVYGSIRKWMAPRGYRLVGPKREIYLEDMLEIQFPIQSAQSG